MTCSTSCSPLPLARSSLVTGRRSATCDDALHLHEARAFDEHRRVRRESRPDLGDQIFDARRNASRRAPNDCAACRASSPSVSRRSMPAARAVVAELRVQLRRAGTELAHVAQHEQLRARARARAPRSRPASIRDSRCRCRRSASRRSRAGLRCEPALDAGEAREARRRSCDAAPPARAAAALAASALLTLCTPGACSDAAASPCRGLHDDLALERAQRVARGDRGRVLETELDDAPAGGEVAP